MKLATAALGSVLAMISGPGRAQPGVSSPMPTVDYADGAHWLCRPGRKDACRTDLRSTIIDSRGHTRIETFKADPAPPVDCFYIYPTVSEAPGVSAPMRATEAEARAARQQAARFSSVCRVFAPLYRQVTVEVMKRGEDGLPVEGLPQAMALAERDVTDAWKHYLVHDNNGRGVVLIGHSQGAGTVLSLIAREIDGKPVQDRLVSAIIAGQFIEVAVGRDLGGTFKAVPACRRASQTGCVIAFDTWRSNRPPSPTHRPEFTRGTELLCTNPAALGGGAGPLKPYLSTVGETIIPFFTAAQGAWTQPPAAVKTPFVQLPDLLTAECVDNPRGDYLSVTLRRSPGDARRAEIAGDVVHRGAVADYGLHLIDLNLTMGNLLEVVRRQSASYTAHRAR